MNDPEAFISLHRYFMWANRLREHFDRSLSKCRRDIETDWSNDLGLFMSHWYGALYVVVEGWQELGLQDSEVDDLLKSPNTQLLRRFRNGSFHFQKQYFDNRFANFWDEPRVTVQWVRSLSGAFSRYFLDRLERQNSEE